jgi:Holliday junction DNA helicase RuvA
VYAYIQGLLTEKEPDAVVVEAGGVGYRILAGSRTLAALPPAGSMVKVYTFHHVREDAHLLYGFLDRDEKEMFRRIIAVSGIGPKLAMSILSGMTPAELAVAVVTEDARAISRINGWGKKTAERLILELKERIANDEFVRGASPRRRRCSRPRAAQEAVQALMALGIYVRRGGAGRVAAAETCQTVEEIIVHALRQLDRG